MKDSIVSTLAASIVYHIVAVLLGAPLVSYVALVAERLTKLNEIWL